MVVLALDTSHPSGSASLARDGKSAGTFRFGTTDSQLVEIAAAVEGLLSSVSIELRSIDRVALVHGPGSFTGLRIGMAFVKGLYATLGIDVVTMNTLELLALPLLKRANIVAPMIDARKEEVYFALYASTEKGGEMSAKALLAPDVARPESAIERIKKKAPPDPLLVVGSGGARYHERLGRLCPGSISLAPEVQSLPSTELLSLVAHRLRPLSHEEIVELEPFYIRPSDAELKRLGQVKVDG